MCLVERRERLNPSGYRGRNAPLARRPATDLALVFADGCGEAALGPAERSKGLRQAIGRHEGRHSMHTAMNSAATLGTIALP